MKSKKLYHSKIFIFSLITMVSLSGCGISGAGSSEETSEALNETDVSSDEQGYTLDMDAYKKRLYENRVLISDYADYQDETEQLKQQEYQKISFENCQFQDFPEFSQLKVLQEKERGITVQESWDTIAKWLEEIGKSNEVDMQAETLVVSEELGLDENGDYFNFYEHMSELSSGAGAFLTNEKCHIQISYSGIYSMSDGKMTAYLGISDRTVHEAMGWYAEDVVEEGSVSELGDRTYTLLSGDLSVRDGAELVKEYFEAGTPFAPADGVTVDVPYVKIFKLNDRYGYNYTVSRSYCGVPIAYTVDQASRVYQTYENYLPNEDNKNAYVVDDTGVSGFCGYNESALLDELYSDTEMLSLSDAAGLLSKNLAAGLNVEISQAGLVYAPLQFFNDTVEIYLFPCWQFIGTNLTKDENICIYVDVFTGDIYYYTFLEDES
jgi:hypothetical protein